MYRIPGSGVGIAGGGVGTLAATGAGVGWWVAIGSTLLVLGALALLVARRRTRKLAGRQR